MPANKFLFRGTDGTNDIVSLIAARQPAQQGWRRHRGGDRRATVLAGSLPLRGRPLPETLSLGGSGSGDDLSAPAAMMLLAPASSNALLPLMLAARSTPPLVRQHASMATTASSVARCNEIVLAAGGTELYGRNYLAA